MAAAKPLVYAIGRSFTEHYYKVFNRQPEELYKLYGEASTYTYGWEGNEGDETYTGIEEIKTKLSTSALGQVKVLSVISSQETVNGGVVVVVTGSWEPSNRSGKLTRRFIETFLLVRGARQDTFYIQNDIFYILQNNAPMFLEVQSHSANPPKSEVLPTEETLLQDSTDQPEKFETKEEELEESVLSEKSEEEHHKQEPEQTNADSEPQIEQHEEQQPQSHQEEHSVPPPAASISYAGLLRGNQNQSQNQNQNQNQNPSLGYKPPQQQNDIRRSGEHKIFVRFPADFPTEQLLDAFRKFGKVTDHYLNRERGFAIITGTDAEFVKASIQASPLNIGGHSIHIEVSKGIPQRGYRGSRGVSRGRGRGR